MNTNWYVYFLDKKKLSNNDLLHLTNEWMNAGMLEWRKTALPPPSLSLPGSLFFLGGGGERPLRPLWIRHC